MCFDSAVGVDLQKVGMPDTSLPMVITVGEQVVSKLAGMLT